MMRLSRSMLILAALMLSACATSDFVSSWKAPDAAPIDIRGSRVAAVVMTRSDVSRRAGEDTLSREISARGAEGVPMYTLVADAKSTSEDTARSMLERAGVDSVVVLRPVRVDNEVVSTPPTYSSPMYGEFWGGYYAAGWGQPWDTTPVEAGPTPTVVSVETLIYSLKQNKLLWAGRSKVTHPGSVDALIRRLASSAAKELQKQGLVAK